MSYPPLSGYHDFSGQVSTPNDDVYSGRNTDSSMYSNGFNNGASTTKSQTQYGSASYDWNSHPQGYANQTVSGYGDNPWRQPAQRATSSAYGRSPSYTARDLNSGLHQSQQYYDQCKRSLTQSNTSRQDGRNSSKLSHASRSDSTRSQSSTSQQYNNVIQAQSRMRFPPETPSQSTLDPPATSYSVQTQTSIGSDGSRQLAINAAAALAGAASRRYADNQSPGHSASAPSAASAPRPHAAAGRRTASPKISTQENAYAQRHVGSNASSTVHSSQHAVNQHRAYSHGPYPLQSTSGQSAQSTQIGYQSSAPPRRDMQDTASTSSLVSAIPEIPSLNRNTSTHQVGNVPGYIDPSQVFNPYHREHERRREQARLVEAEAERRAEKAIRKEQEVEETIEGARHEAEQALADSQASVVKPKEKRKSNPKMSKRLENAVNSPAMEATEDRAMAAEIKAMLEKMKAFRSKDPSLFQKLWSDIQDEPDDDIGAAQILSPPVIQSPNKGSAQISIGEMDVSQSGANKPELSNNRAAPFKDAANKREHRPQSDTDGNPIHLNGYKVVVENNPDGLPDLGRFPAERRVRTKYNSRGKKTEERGEAMEKNDEQSAVTSSVRVVPNNGSTVWPVEKRDALTSSALKALKSIPANSTIQLTEDDIHKMLDQNPTYIGLCELLEAKGLKLHRGHFARELLNSVPDLIRPIKRGHMNKSSRNVTAEESPLPPPPPLPPRYIAPPPGRFPPAAPFPVNHNGTFNTFQPIDPSLPGAMEGKTKKSTPLRARPGPVPGTKEAAARKRNFEELIDMTELDDDENYVMPSKFARLDESDVNDGREIGTFEAWQRPPAAIKVGYYAPDGAFVQPDRIIKTGQRLNFDAQPYSQHRVGEPVPQIISVDHSKKMLLAKNMDKADAAKKPYYDPRTVARDILIASGRHPIERPLNVHLAGMLGTYIELESDVSTFEWDEIDPGGPAAPQVPYVDVPVAKPRFKIGDRIRRGPRGPRPTTIDKTRPPETEKRPAVRTSTPATPVQPASTKQQTQSEKISRPSRLSHSLLASDDQATPATRDPTRPVSPPRRPRSSSRQLPDSAQKPARTDKMETPTVRRRGRPPGSKNKYAKLGDFKEQGARLSSINIPPTPSQQAVDNKFKCRWKECNTVLHNLDTLRKHIGKIHRPTQEEAKTDGFTCWWRHCQYLVMDEDGDLRTSKMFSQWEDWLKHIEKEHISPLGQKWGDGPSTRHVDPIVIAADRKAYLSDSKGREVTPAIDLERPQDYPGDVPNLTRIMPFTTAEKEKNDPDASAYRAFLKAHNVAKDSRGASQQIVQALKRRKEQIGPGIERGGCTLITQGMREGFISAPNIRRIVDERC